MRVKDLIYLLQSRVENQDAELDFCLFLKETSEDKPPMVFQRHFDSLCADFNTVVSYNEESCTIDLTQALSSFVEELLKKIPGGLAAVESEEIKEAYRITKRKRQKK